jgi:hypothetical protein
MFADIEICDIEDDIEESERCTGIIDDLVCEP